MMSIFRLYNGGEHMRLFRMIAIAVDDAFKGAIAGPVTVQYVEIFDDGSHVIAETQAVLN